MVGSFVVLICYFMLVIHHSFNHSLFMLVNIFIAIYYSFVIYSFIYYSAYMFELPSNT